MGEHGRDRLERQRRAHLYRQQPHGQQLAAQGSKGDTGRAAYASTRTSAAARCPRPHAARAATACAHCRHLRHRGRARRRRPDGHRRGGLPPVALDMAAGAAPRAYRYAALCTTIRRRYGRRPQAADRRRRGRLDGTGLPTTVDPACTYARGGAGGCLYNVTVTPEHVDLAADPAYAAHRAMPPRWRPPTARQARPTAARCQSRPRNAALGRRCGVRPVRAVTAQARCRPWVQLRCSSALSFLAAARIPTAHRRRLVQGPRIFSPYCMLPSGGTR